MVPFTFEDSKSEILINEFMKGRDFHEVMDMLPVYEGEDIAQGYLDAISEFLENPTEQPPEEFIFELRNGFEYLYGKMPEDITTADCLLDTIKACVNIASRGRMNELAGKYAGLKTAQAN